MRGLGLVVVLLALCACPQKDVIDAGTPLGPDEDAGTEAVDAGIEAPPPIVEGPDAGLLWVQGTFRVAGGGAEGVVSLHERGASDQCEAGTGPERTTTRANANALINPKRQATVAGFVRFVFGDAQKAKLPAETPLCVRYFNGNAQWFLVREVDATAEGVIDFGTFTVRGAPTIRRVTSGGNGALKAEIDSVAVSKRMELIDALEASGNAEAVKSERSRMLEEFGTDNTYKFDKKLKPKDKAALGKLCRTGCSAADKKRLDFANDLPGL
ncbi:MAG: hypothetical protein QM817_32475 [Archangium sp.]